MSDSKRRRTNDDSDQSEHSSLQDDRASLQDDHALLQDDSASLQDVSASLQDDRASLQDNRASLQDDRASLQDDRASLQDDRASLQDDPPSLQDDRASLHDDSASLQEDRSSLQDDRSSLQDASSISVDAPAPSDPDAALSRWVLQGVEVTHLQSTLIAETQCYLMNVALMDRARSSLDRRLGCVVQYVGKCQISGCLKCTASPGCGPCRHQFSCECQDKYRGTHWCPHIHLAYRMNLARYRRRVCLYVHNYRNTTAETRHLRAFVQGKAFMQTPDDARLVFEEKHPSPPEMTRKIVRYLADKTEPCDCKVDKKCDVCEACRCFYECDCDDFARQMQVCQHCHWVAMTRSEDPNAMFEDPPGENQFRKLTHCDPEVTNVSEEVSIIRWYFLEQQHELSYTLSKDYLQLPFDATKTRWYFKDSQIRVKKLEDVCRDNCRELATMRWHCDRCNVCIHNYRCRCKDGRFALCKHIHYIARKIRNLKESLLERKTYLSETLLSQHPPSIGVPMEVAEEVDEN